MARERIELSDPRELLRALQRLAASRLGRELGLGLLIFAEPRLAQYIIDIDSAVDQYGSDIKHEWEMLKRRVVRKAVIPYIRKLSETTRLIMATAREEKGDEPRYEEGKGENLLGI